MIDIEKMLVAALNSNQSVSETGAQATTDIPPDPNTFPWVRVTLISDRQGSVAPWFLWNMVQVDAYASKTGGQEEARDVADAVRTALHALADMDYDTIDIMGGGVVTDVQTSMRRVPDASLEPARQRYIIDAYIYALPRVQIEGG